MQPKKKRTKEKHRLYWKTRFKMVINTYLSIITVNVNGLNVPITGQNCTLNKKAKAGVPVVAQ